MRENKRTLLVLVGSAIAGFGIYVIFKGTTQKVKKLHRGDKAILLLGDKKTLTPVEEFIERRKRRAMARRKERERAKRNI